MSGQLSFDGFEPPAPQPPRRKHVGDAVFFAVLPDAAASERIAALAIELRQHYRLHGQPTPADRLHISLRGLLVPRELADELGETIGAAAGIGDPAFEVAFDRVVSFKNRSGSKPLVVWPGEVRGLQHDLRARAPAHQAITRCRRFEATIGGSFTPHMTMLYDPETVLQRPVEPIGWRVKEVMLLHSLRGQGRHRILHRWALRG